MEKLEFVIAARDEFHAVFSRLTGYLPSLKTMALASGAALAGMGAAIKATADSYETLRKVSENLGVSTKALNELHYAAQLSDVSQEKFNKSLQVMTIRASQAADGNQQAASAILELGFNVQQFARLDPAQKFMAVAESMEGVRDRSDKARIASQLFGDEGVALLQIMTNGAAGIRAARAEIERFGVSVSAQAGANAAKFNDSLTRVTMSLTGLRNEAAEKVMPIITGLSNRFADFVADNRAGIIDFGENFIGVLGKVLEFSALTIGRSIDGWASLQGVWYQLKGTFAEFVADIVTGWSEVQNLMLRFVETVNVGGIFDGQVESHRQLRESALETMQALQNMSAEAYLQVSEIASRATVSEKIKEISDTVRQAIADMRAEGTGQPLIFDDDSTANAKANVNAMSNAQRQAWQQLLTDRDQYLQSDYQRLDQWYDRQIELFNGHKNEMLLVDQLYAARAADIEKNAADELAAYKRMTDQREQSFHSKHLSAMANMFSNFANSGIAGAKELAIVGTLFATYEAAMKAYSSLADIPKVGPVLGAAAAAAAIAYGLAQVNQIKSADTRGQAHAGLDYVPNEGTYLLDRGERVIQPKQNEDLTKFLAAGRSDGLRIDALTLNIEVKAQTKNDLLDMSRADWRHVIIDKLVPGLRSAAKDGVTI